MDMYKRVVNDNMLTLLQGRFDLVANRMAPQGLHCLLSSDSLCFSTQCGSFARVFAASARSTCTLLTAPPHRSLVFRARRDIDHMLQTRRSSFARPLEARRSSALRFNAQAPPTGDHIVIHGRKLHYRVGGSGPNVILIHGASGSLEDWTFQHFDVLCASYRVLVFDRPGLGRSSPSSPCESLSAQAALMRDAASALGMTTAVLVGHSYGGAVALAWARDAPAQVHGLVLVAAVTRTFKREPNWLYGVVNVPAAGWLASQFVSLVANRAYVARVVAAIFAPQVPPDGFLESGVSPRVLSPSVFRNNAMQVRALAGEMAALGDSASRLNVRIEVLHGVEDNIVSVDSHAIAFAKAVPRAYVTILEGVGHMLHHSHPEQLYAAIERVLQD